jgi:16S rRNA processing protein RimM
MGDVVEWVIVGRFGRPHGLKGFAVVNSFTEPRENLLKYTDWNAYLNNKWQPIKLEHIEVNTKSIIAKVEGYAGRDEVSRLTNVNIGVKRDALPELTDGDFYWHQLIGMQVKSVQGIEFGKVVEILATGSNDVLVIEGKQRYLIPYLPGKVVLNVDEQNKTILVDWEEDF